MSVMDTGFVSQEQEDYLRMNEPSLYKAVLKKHGAFVKAKKRQPVVNTGSPSSTTRTKTVGRSRR